MTPPVPVSKMCFLGVHLGPEKPLIAADLSLDRALLIRCEPALGRQHYIHAVAFRPRSPRPCHLSADDERVLELAVASGARRHTSRAMRHNRPIPVGIEVLVVDRQEMHEAAPWA